MITDDIALTLQPMIGPKAAAHILACFGSAEAIFGASKEELIEKSEIRPEIAAQITRKLFHKQAEKELAFCQKNGITPIVSTSGLYPTLLRECNDYPHVLYYRGDPEALCKKMVSIVGTRRITSYGQKMCEKIVTGLACMFPDINIVSGLAFGIDGACHRAAVAAGVSTVGILANPLTEIYPAQHAALATEMMKKGGGILSEYHSETKNKGVTFVPRNRIIAGLSLGTVVVESALKGGSLITANMADGYDRCVMAVPGRAGDTYSEGTNYLIKNNKARMVCSAEDIARELMWDMPETKPSGTPDTGSLGEDARNLFMRLPEGEPVSIDLLSEISGLSVSGIAPLILELEFEGFVRVLPGKMYEKA